MKRSLAPSRLSQTVQKQKCLPSFSCENKKEDESKTKVQKEEVNEPIVRDVVVDRDTNIGVKMTPEPKRRRLLTKPLVVTKSDNKMNENRPIETVPREEGNDNQSLTESYKVYSVMHCKWSKKKHKVYEDGVMLIQGRKLTLKDMTGKDITKSLLGNDVLSRLQEGENFVSGGREIEISCQLNEEEFISGKIFMSHTSNSSTTVNVPTSLKSRPFIPPTKGGVQTSPKPIVIKSLFDPNGPESIVLYRSFKPDEASLVIDPFLGRNLRPHQQDGVKFLYSCLMGERQCGAGCILADGKICLKSSSSFSSSSFFKIFSFILFKNILIQQIISF
jgi:SNF2 family DNA or RNA helicase